MTDDAITFGQRGQIRRGGLAAHSRRLGIAA